MELSRCTITTTVPAALVARKAYLAISSQDYFFKSVSFRHGLGISPKIILRCNHRLTQSVATSSGSPSPKLAEFVLLLRSVAGGYSGADFFCSLLAGLEAEDCSCSEPDKS